MVDVQDVLGCPMGPNDAGASTVREYLVALLAQLWKEGESFSGKRPFGNSSWEFDLYASLIKAGIVPGTLDEDGYVEEVHLPTAYSLVQSAIESLAKES